MRLFPLFLIFVLSACGNVTTIQHPADMQDAEVAAAVDLAHQNGQTVLVLRESPRNPYPRGTMVTACTSMSEVFDLARVQSGITTRVDGCRVMVVTSAHPRSRNYLPGVGEVDVWEFQENFRDYFFLGRWPQAVVPNKPTLAEIVDACERLWPDRPRQVEACVEDLLR